MPLTVTEGCMVGGWMLTAVHHNMFRALLISCPVAQHDSEIHVRNLQERPYMEMTLNGSTISESSMFMKNEGEDIFSIKGGQT